MSFVPSIPSDQILVKGMVDELSAFEPDDATGSVAFSWPLDDETINAIQVIAAANAVLVFMRRIPRLLR